MEDKDSKISQELNKNKIASAPYENVEAKDDAPRKNAEGQQEAENSMPVSEDVSNVASEKKDLLGFLGEKYSDTTRDDYYRKIKKISDIINVCKGKKGYEDFCSNDIDTFLNIFSEGKERGNIFSAFNAYRDFLKSYRVTSGNASSKEFFQQIFYGAPGTGKSHEVKEKTKGQKVVRTTFHPDSDYSTFVGAYKPTMDETKIVYKFVSQAFLKAYMIAWKELAEKGEDSEKVYLVIEEINRGNCAQIFGDLFQLLDRSENGFSKYPIEADSDLQKEIEKAFRKDGEYGLAEGFAIKEDAIDGYTSNYPNSNLTEDIKRGRVLLLPPNLYIWATMNTSDQSLFPIDSAFKRRWDWAYVPITNAGKNWKIKADDQTYDWWDFLETINKKIEEVTKSEDKQLGYFFCKPKPDNPEEISADTFVGKVVFYLWNDVFKDFNYNASSPFKKKEGAFSFRDFYLENGEGVKETTVVDFLKNLGLNSDEEKDKPQQDNNGASNDPVNNSPGTVASENETTNSTDSNNASDGVTPIEE